MRERERLGNCCSALGSPFQFAFQLVWSCLSCIGSAFCRLWRWLTLPFVRSGLETELELKRLEYARTAPVHANHGQQINRRASFAAAASDAMKVFEGADVNHDEALSADEVIRLQGITEAGAAARLSRLLAIFDEEFEERGGLDKEHFKEIHYRMNKKAQAMVHKGESSAAKGEMLM